MSWATSIALVCRFYGQQLNVILEMTMPQFCGLLREIGAILKLENGSDEKKPTPLSGEQGFAMAQKIFKKGNRH